MAKGVCYLKNAFFQKEIRSWRLAVILYSLQNFVIYALHLSPSIVEDQIDFSSHKHYST